MSVREEEREKNSCPSRGLGLAAAAIGVGVGAALYYLFSKRQENPHGEGSTDARWTLEEQQTLCNCSIKKSTDEDESNSNVTENSNTSNSMSSSDSEESTISNDAELDSYSTISVHSISSSNFDNEENSIDFSEDSFHDTLSHHTTSSVLDFHNDLNDMEWDITSSSADIPVDTSRSRSPLLSLVDNISSFLSPRRKIRIGGDDGTAESRSQAFRKRSWSLEECSICFDVILKDQDITTLPCTHHFHSTCIAPWLAERQTCPNCRKASE